MPHLQIHNLAKGALSVGHIAKGVINFLEGHNLRRRRAKETNGGQRGVHVLRCSRARGCGPFLRETRFLRFQFLSVPFHCTCPSLSIPRHTPDGVKTNAMRCDRIVSARLSLCG